MYVDDRLATVLNARADGKVAMRIQYRQLLDLVGTSPADARGDLLDAAHLRLGELARAIPTDERARMLTEPGVRLRNPRLVAELSDDHPTVALAAIRAARLNEDQWLDLVPALPLAARGLIRHRRDLGPAMEARLEQLGIADRGLPPADMAAQAQPGAVLSPGPATAPPVTDNILHLTPRDEAPAGIAAARPAAPAPGGSQAAEGDGIGAIVRRIEAFRKNREAAEALRPANDAPRLPLGENDDERDTDGLYGPRAFAFATDSAGRIGWADPAVAGMVCGMLLPSVAAAPGTAPAFAPTFAEVFRRRQPIRAAYLTLDGAAAIAGQWQVDAGPQFDDAGHFTGYVGRFRRPAPHLKSPPQSPEADRIRQILHELRTPVNAIQGFAEMIHQQLLGAAPHEYRALAASIAADAARMLAGFDELDRLARLDSGALQLDPGETDFAMVIAGIVHQLEPHTAARSSGFTLAADQGDLLVPLALAEAEQFAWRLLATLAGAARPGETIALELRRDDSAIVLAAALPVALAHLDGLFDAAPPAGAQALSAGVFGTGFALRLAAAEARAAGGRLDLGNGALRLVLPACPAGNAVDSALAAGFQTPPPDTTASAR